jgi:hypothetical protein
MVFVVGRARRRGVAAAPLRAPIRNARGSQWSTYDVGAWSLDVLLWHTPGSTADLLSLRVHRGSDFVRLWFSDLDRMDGMDGSSENDGSTFRDAIDEADARSGSFLAVELSERGVMSVATDALGSERCFVRQVPAQLTFANEAWTLLQNVAIESGRRLERPKPPHERRLCFALAANTSTPLAPSCLRAKPAATPSHQTIRKLVVARTRELAQSFRSLAVMLSGGIDSSAVAAAAAEALPSSRVTFVHVKFPEGYRAWETVIARQTARTLGITLAEVQLAPENFVNDRDVERDIGRHPWLGWHLQVQREATPYGDAMLTGRSGQWFGGDAPQLMPSAVARAAVALWRTGVWRVLPLRSWTKGLLFRPSKSTIAPSEYLWSFTPGQRYLYANPFAGRCVPKYCPFQTVESLQCANAMVGTGLRLDKLALRLAFASTLPRSAIATGRVGSPLLSRVAWRGLGARELAFARKLETGDALFETMRASRPG